MNNELLLVIIKKLQMSSRHVQATNISKTYSFYI